MDTDMDESIGVIFNRKKNEVKKRRKMQEESKKTAVEDRVDADEGDHSPTTATSLFDYSAENHFKAVDTISKLCGEPENPDFDPAEIDRLASSITFLREWKHFKYPSRTIRFASQNKSKEGKDIIDEITLPQFSSAIVPKILKDTMDKTTTESCKDYVMYVGGSVWALDWCPRVNSFSDTNIRTEYIAVAAHSPESSYHRMGAPLTGRGVIQIWCVVNENTKEHDLSHIQKRQKRSYKKPETEKEDSNVPQKPRGRPRKYPVKESVNKIDSSIQRRQRGRPRKHAIVEYGNVTDSISEEVQHVDIQCVDNSPSLLSIDVANSNTCEHIPEKDSRMEPEVCDHKISDDKSSTSELKFKVNISKEVQTPENHLPMLMQDDIGKFSSVNIQEPLSSDPDLMRCKDHAINSCDTDPARHSLPKDISLPRMVLCLAHNGKVAWDLKWRPSNVYDKHRMGYLAVLLGNGALEVWEVPFPKTVEAIYSRCQKEGTDPRFIKMEPVFRCSALKCGDRQSIPIALEWSSSSPYDMIVVGCHDGVVALWKFHSTGSSINTKPFLCFSADTVPIRALSWAPAESNSESSNVIITASNKGLKFWDIRDPFHPLWDFPLKRIIYSVDWVKDPSCVVAAIDDGSIRFLSLATTSNDVPVTGTPFVGAAMKGYHSYSCSSFPIWSIQASRLPGFIAYCTADGTALYFQLTARAVEKDPTRNRAPHFLSGSLNEEESTLTVFTPLPNTPFAMTRSTHESASRNELFNRPNQEKRGLSCDDEIEMELEMDDTMVAQKSKQAAKLRLRPCSENNSKAEEVVQGEEDKFEGSFPPKIVAMHKVRWNLNQGSENWLCFGGAAGILRCQEIDIKDW